MTKAEKRVQRILGNNFISREVARELMHVKISNDQWADEELERITERLLCIENVKNVFLLPTPIQTFDKPFNLRTLVKQYSFRIIEREHKHNFKLHKSAGGFIDGHWLFFKVEDFVQNSHSHNLAELLWAAKMLQEKNVYLPQFGNITCNTYYIPSEPITYYDDDMESYLYGGFFFGSSSYSVFPAIGRDCRWYRLIHPSDMKKHSSSYQARFGKTRSHSMYFKMLTKL